MPSLIKELMLKEYVENFSQTKGFMLAEFKGLSADETNNVRRELEKTKASCKVIKNRLAKRTFSECKIEGLDDILSGSTTAILTQEDIIQAAKVLVKCSKKFKLLKIKGGFLEGKLLSDKDVIELSLIPSREQLLAKLLMCMQAPITGLVSVLNGVQRNFVCVLNAIKEQKEK